MGKTEEERLLMQTLNTHLNTIHETLQVLDQAPASSSEKRSWEDVLKMGEQVSKQATIVGMLWSGEKPEAKSVEENMKSYFNTLQGLLLLSHASLVGAGPTLSSIVHASMKQVVDSSFRLMVEAVSSYGPGKQDVKLVVPQLVGAVWESCSALKKTPATNITAIGRAMTKVAVSVKDVLREMKDLRPESSDTAAVELDDTSKPIGNLSDNENMSYDDLGNDLSPEEMKVAQLASMVVSEIIVVIKELIRTISSLLKQEKPADNDSFVGSLEFLLKQCQETGLQVDELGACLYPPQEIPAMKAALENISNIISKMEIEVESLKSSTEAFFQACNGLKSSIKAMVSELDTSATADVETKLHSVSISEREG